MHFFRQTLKRLCQSTLPRQWMMFHGPRGARSVALTFDDGPHPVYTPQLLDELARLDVRATFFVLGEQAAQHPDLVRRIHDEGHTLGHHTWTHADPSTPASQLFDEVRDCRELLESLTGEPCNLFRPPRGHLTFAKTCGLWRQHQQIVLWNVDPEDCAMPSQEAAHTWAKCYLPRGGDVVLLHDDHPIIVPLVQAIVEHVQIAGLTTTTVSNWDLGLPTRSASEGSADATARRLQGITNLKSETPE